MKKQFFTLIMAMALTVFLAAAASAKMGSPKSSGVQPIGNEKTGEVTIPALPAGETLMQVIVFNDHDDTPMDFRGPISKFKLEKYDSFNYIWKDSAGVSHWEMVTPYTHPGGDLQSVCHPKGYKYGFSSAAEASKCK